MKQGYTVGFLHNRRHIALIRKTKPEWQAGFLNGIGGHIEHGELPHACMVREFEEEAGTKIDTWTNFLTLVGENATIYCYYHIDEDNKYIYDVDSKTDEEVIVLPIDKVGAAPFETIDNLKWIIPLMLQAEKYETAKIRFIGDA